MEISLKEEQTLAESSKVEATTELPVVPEDEEIFDSPEAAPRHLRTASHDTKQSIEEDQVFSKPASPTMALLDWADEVNEVEDEILRLKEEKQARELEELEAEVLRTRALDDIPVSSESNAQTPRPLLEGECLSGGPDINASDLSIRKGDETQEIETNVNTNNEMLHLKTQVANLGTDSEIDKHVLETPVSSIETADVDTDSPSSDPHLTNLLVMLQNSVKVTETDNEEGDLELTDIEPISDSHSHEVVDKDAALPINEGDAYQACDSHDLKDLEPLQVSRPENQGCLFPSLPNNNAPELNLEPNILSEESHTATMNIDTGRAGVEASNLEEDVDARLATTEDPIFETDTEGESVDGEVPDADTNIGSSQPAGEVSNAGTFIERGESTAKALVDVNTSSLEPEQDSVADEGTEFQKFSYAQAAAISFPMKADSPNEHKATLQYDICPSKSDRGMVARPFTEVQSRAQKKKMRMSTSVHPSIEDDKQISEPAAISAPPPLWVGTHADGSEPRDRFDSPMSNNESPRPLRRIEQFKEQTLSKVFKTSHSRRDRVATLITANSFEVLQTSSESTGKSSTKNNNLKRKKKRQTKSAGLKVTPPTTSAAPAADTIVATIVNTTADTPTDASTDTTLIKSMLKVVALIILIVVFFECLHSLIWGRHDRP